MLRPNFTTNEFLRPSSITPVTVSALKAQYENPKKRRCEELVNFCDTSSSHGLAHMVDPKELFGLRIAWAIIVASFLGFAVYFVYLSIANLTNHTLTSEILTNYNEASERGMALPDIHICDASIFNNTKLQEMGFDGTLATFLVLATSENARNAIFANDTSGYQTLKKEFDRILTKGNLTMKDVVERTSIECVDMLLGCSRLGQWHLAEECCSKFFMPEPFVTIFGSCITTHGIPNFQLYESRDAGFVVYALPNTQHIIDFNVTLIKAEYILQQGVYYAVSSPFIHPETVLHTAGRFAWPDAWVSVPITKSLVDNSELKDNYLAPYTCVDSSDSAVMKLKTPEYHHYSETNCITSIWQKNFRSAYNCSALYYNYGNSKVLCDPVTILTLDFSLIEAGSPVERPSTICPIGCLAESYDLAPSYAQINKDILISKYGLTELGNTTQGLVVLHFFYSSFAYQVRKSHTNTLIKWLGEVGGNMGLFLGASLVTIVEVFALCLRCCFRSSL